jgi:glyoxylase-like metal-dependent hydrolase (beta-lactamase superfamily II)
VDHPDATVNWDTGSHPDAVDGYWPAPLYEAFAHPHAGDRDLPTVLADVGDGVDDVDCVVQSHRHVDYAGGLEQFAATDVSVSVNRRELEPAYLSANSPAGGDAFLASDFDRDRTWRVIDRPRYRLLDGVELLHVPGHTPGLLGAYLARDAAEEVWVAGDAAFLEANFVPGRSMGASLLSDPRAAEESVLFLQVVLTSCSSRATRPEGFRVAGRVRCKPGRCARWPSPDRLPTARARYHAIGVFEQGGEPAGPSPGFE